MQALVEGHSKSMGKSNCPRGKDILSSGKDELPQANIFLSGAIMFLTRVNT
jgi:hypothetical protein